MGPCLGKDSGMTVLKRRADAERAGDRIYAVVRGRWRSLATDAEPAVIAPKWMAKSWRSVGPMRPDGTWAGVGGTDRGAWNREHPSATWWRSRR